MDAIVASGRLSAVDDREVQRRLAGLHAEIDDAVEEQWEAQQFFAATQAPELFGVLDLSELSYLSDQFSAGLFVKFVSIDGLASRLIPIHTLRGMRHTQHCFARPELRA